MRHAQRVKAAALASLASLGATAGIAQGIGVLSPPPVATQASAPAKDRAVPRSKTRLIVIRQPGEQSAPGTIYVNAPPATTVQAPAPAPVTSTS